MHKQFAVIGLGRFGTSLARTLYKLGQEVLAIDTDEERLRYVAEEVTHTLLADTTDVNVLKSIGIANFDVVVVSIWRGRPGQYYDYAALEGIGRTLCGD